MDLVEVPACRSGKHFQAFGTQKCTLAVCGFSLEPAIIPSRLDVG
jgi:hypothetical protein